ncbi:MAG: ferrous iron transport protein A [Archaeoglobi archaeon]|nr:ferrous iron transport protein A [Candidatus Mnemosynella sp.]
MSLSEVKEGKTVRIAKLNAPPGQRRRLMNLGLIPGEEIRVLKSAAFHGPVLIEVNGREIALGRGIASRVMVEEIQS